MAIRLRLTMMIPLAEKANGNLRAKDDFKPDPVEKVQANTDLNTFTVELSPTGQPPATHLWCCWGGLTGYQFGLLRASIQGVPGSKVYVTPNAMENAQGNEKLPADILKELGLQPIETEATATKP